jgi:hypothetical protein
MKLIFILCTLFFSGLSFGQWQDSFSTKLNPYLLIAGKKCLGGEVSETTQRLCKKDYWLINIDRTVQGQTFISHLKRVNIMTPTTVALYEIKPKDRIPFSYQMLMRRYWVRFDLNGEALVMKKPIFQSSPKLPTSISSDGSFVHTPF